MQHYQICTVFGNVHVGNLAYYKRVTGLVQKTTNIILIPIKAIQTIPDGNLTFPNFRYCVDGGGTITGVCGNDTVGSARSCDDSDGNIGDLKDFDDNGTFFINCTGVDLVNFSSSDNAVFGVEDAVDGVETVTDVVGVRAFGGIDVFFAFDFLWAVTGVGNFGNKSAINKKGEVAGVGTVINVGGDCAKSCAGTGDGNGTFNGVGSVTDVVD